MTINTLIHNSAAVGGTPPKAVANSRSWSKIKSFAGAPTARRIVARRAKTTFRLIASQALLAAIAIATRTILIRTTSLAVVTATNAFIGCGRTIKCLAATSGHGG